MWLSSAIAGDAHIGSGDCTHWCLPGVPNLWSTLLADVLHSIATGDGTHEWGPRSLGHGHHNHSICRLDGLLARAGLKCN